MNAAGIIMFMHSYLCDRNQYRQDVYIYWFIASDSVKMV